MRLLSAAGALAAPACTATPAMLSTPGYVAAAMFVGSADPMSQVVTLQKRGDCSLQYAASRVTTDGEPWLMLAQGATGTLAPGGSAQLRIGFDARALAIGTYLGSVTVTGQCSTGRVAKGSPRVIVISLTVRGRPSSNNCPAKLEGQENESFAQPGCNDTVATADRYLPSTVLTGVLGEAVDVDIFRFDVTEAPAVFRVEVRAADDVPSGAAPRPVVDVLDANGGVFAHGPSGPEVDAANVSSREVFFPSVETFYARVRNTGAGAVGASARYTLSLAREPLQNLERSFPLDETFELTPTAQRPIAWIPRIRVALEGASRLSASVLAARLGLANVPDYRLYLYDVEDLAAPVLIEQNEDESPTTTDPGLGWTSASSARYYLLVLDWSDSLVGTQPLRFKLDCAPGTLPFRLPNQAGPTCLAVPASCAPARSAACASRPNLVSNGGFEDVPLQSFDPPPAWSAAAQPVVYDQGCDEGSSLEGCYGFPTNFFGAGVGPSNGRRFGGLTSPIAQVVAPLVPGRTYYFSAMLRQRGQGGLDAPGAVQLRLSADVGSLETGSVMGLSCPSPGPGAPFAARAFLFTAPPDAATLPVLGLSALAQSYQPGNVDLGLDEVELVDVTACP